VLNVGPIEKIHNSEIIVEHSPPEGIQFHKLLSGASIITVGCNNQISVVAGGSEEGEEQ